MVTLTSEFDALEQMAVIEVQDNGVGIAEKDQEQIIFAVLFDEGAAGDGVGIGGDEEDCGGASWGD